MPALPMEEAAAASEQDAPVRTAAGAAAAGADGMGIGPLRLAALLGEGGLSRVWLAETPAGERVALKTLKPSWAKRPRAAPLLRREWALLDSLRHPNVVSALAFIEHQGTPALVMEYLSGGDLVSLIGAHPRHWIGAVHQVGQALRRLEQAGFAHRDVKAGNVLFGEDGRARLIDFGSAMPIGGPAGEGGVTAAHCPPTAKGALVGGEEDTYALAVLVYQLMSGRLPHGARPPPGAVPSPPHPLPVEWREEPPLMVLSETVQAVLAPPSGDQQMRAAGRLSAFLDVIESVVAAYPRQ